MKRRLLIGGSAALATSAAIGVTFMQDGRYEQQVADQLEPPAPTPLHRALVHYATLAASSHNTQPWRFRLATNSVRVAPDVSRRTPVVDPDDHHLFASVGCAIENLAIAARQFGRSGYVSPPGANGEVVVSLEASAAPVSPLFDAIPQRQCSRSTYDSSVIPVETLDSLVDSDGAVDMFVITDDALRENILALVLDGNRRQLQDQDFRSELKSWLRFNPNAAARSRDGLLTSASGSPSLPDWLGPFVYDLTVNADGDNDRVATQLRSSSGLVVFSAERDEPSGWVAAGRAYQRFALRATLAGLQHAFVNQAVEVPVVRHQLQSLLGLGLRRANLIVRFGRGPEMPRSLRRPVEDVIST